MTHHDRHYINEPRGELGWRLALLRAWGEESEAEHLLEMNNRIQRAFGFPEFTMPAPLTTGLPDLVTCPADVKPLGNGRYQVVA